jgi:hypothetical protein
MNLLPIFSILVVLGQENEHFDLNGKWISQSDEKGVGSVELNFYSPKRLVVKLIPGGEIEYSYTIDRRQDYFVLNLFRESQKENSAGIYLIKVVDNEKIKFQVIRHTNRIRWEKRENKFNTGLAIRKK